jgi:hypothetical protein
MPIVLDPNKQLVNILTYYIEEVKKTGNSIFRFINSAESLNEWKTKGYLTKSEVMQKKKEGMPVDTEKIIEELRTVWRRLTWAEHNSISSKCMINIPSPDGQIRVNWDAIRFRDLKLKTCLKGWDLLDENGNKIPVTTTVIDNLAPEVAHQLVNDFEKVTEPNEDDLGN